MIEIYIATRRSTGKIRLIIIPAANANTLKREIQKHILRGSLIFTESHRGYTFLRWAGYIHRLINHRHREFSRLETIVGENILVSTNAAEGLFGRVKQLCRLLRLKRVPFRSYDIVWAECLWREYALGPQSEWQLRSLQFYT